MEENMKLNTRDIQNIINSAHLSLDPMLVRELSKEIDFVNGQEIVIDHEITIHPFDGVSHDAIVIPRIRSIQEEEVVLRERGAGTGWIVGRRKVEAGKTRSRKPKTRKRVRR